MKRLFLMTIFLGIVIILSASTVQGEPLAQACDSNWQAAINIISNQCTQSITDNSVCNGHQTVQVFPARPEFSGPGSYTSVHGLQNVFISPQISPDDWGIAWFKLIAPTALPGVTSGQAVIFVAFGNTSVTNIQESGSTFSMNDPGYCTARLKPGSTTYGGSYMRVMPDPHYQSECVTPGCTDKDNLMHFVAEGVPLAVLATRPAHDTVLVRDSYATGWMNASSAIMDLSSCNMNALPVLTDNDLLNGLHTSGNTSSLTSFYLTQQGGQAVCQDIPPGGLIAHDPTHQNVEFFANGVQVELGSTAFLRGDSNGTGITLLVLQGSSQVTKGGVSVSALAGDVVDALGATPRLVQGGAFGRWCQQLSQMVAAIFPGVPRERWDYCANPPTGSGRAVVNLADAYVGRWVNDNPQTAGIVYFDIAFDNNLPYMHWFSACEAGACDNGTIQGVWEDGVRLLFTQTSRTSVQTFSAWLDDQTLYMTTSLHFTGSSERQEYSLTETFHKQRPVG